MDKKLYNVKEVADLLGYHWKTIYNWILDGKMNATQIGRFWKVEREEVEYIKTNGLRNLKQN